VVYDKNVNDYNNIKLGLLNTRSLAPNVDGIHGLLSDGLDILLLTETWHGSSDNVVVGLAHPPEFNFKDKVRLNDPFHGGLIVFYKNKFKCQNIPLSPLQSFEAMSFVLALGVRKIVFLLIYRPGSAPITNVFFQELSSVLEHITLLGSDVVVAGDFNIHIEKSEKLNSTKLLELFEVFHLYNRVIGSTHICGGTLDLIVTSESCLINDLMIYPPGVFSDHSLVTGCLFWERPKIIRKKSLIRSWSRMDKDLLESCLSNSPISGSVIGDDVDEIFDVFRKELIAIADKVAPLRWVVWRDVPSAPWFNGLCKNTKVLCRRKERKYRKSGNVEDKMAWMVALRERNNCYSDSRKQFWFNKITGAANQPKILWNVVNKILCRNENVSNAGDIIEHSANDFLNFFVDKVKGIEKLTENYEYYVFDPERKHDHNSIKRYVTCSEDQVRKIVMNAPTKSCNLDQFPTHIFKEYIDYFITYFTGMINISLTKGIFPNCHKHAIVTPLLKKPGLDSSDLNNFRPVSNLSFVSKIIERVVSLQLRNYLNVNNLLPLNQSGYRNFHSTETALLNIASDMFLAMDEQKVTLIALLDMSAAFDCVNHKLLVDRLQASYGILEIALEWVKSFLSRRSQQVGFLGKLSQTEFLSAGVPQGSVLGPLFFLLYTAPIFQIIESFGFKCHGFADDIQISLAVDPANMPVAIDRLVDCINNVDQWLGQNRLKLNQAKTQFMLVGTWQQLRLVNPNSVLVGGVEIEFSRCVSNLGFVFDEHLSMGPHMQSLIKKCTFQLRKLRHVRKSLDRNTFIMLVHAFIGSRLDYCNSLFYGITKKCLSKLQVLQNQAARLIFGKPVFEHASPLLRELHWLPIEKRILFKIGLIVFKCLNGLAPGYLSCKCVTILSQPSHERLRSACHNTLCVRSRHLKTADRDFSVAGPVFWNSLPNGLRQTGLSLAEFRRRLKTFLFD